MPQDNFLRYEASGIAALLRTRSLAVPFYQRSYSWRTLEGTDGRVGSTDDKLQVVDYWNDLINSFQQRVSYFLGTVVVAHEAAEDRQLVIDGQQRLATTSLLLAAIRDQFFERGQDQYGKSAQQDYLGKFDRIAGCDLPKLILNTDDHDFYDRRIVKQ